MLRRYAETRYAAKSWGDNGRRVVARIEASTMGLDIRFVVTSLKAGSAEHIYDTLYCARGQAENLIKLHKARLKSDRTSCRSANDEALARQVFGERLPGGALTFERGDVRRPSGGHLGGKVIFTGAGLKLFELQLELVEQTATALRVGAEALAAQLGDLQLEVCNQGLVGGSLGTCARKFRLGFGGAPGHGNHQRLQRFNVVRQVRNGSFHDRNESTSGALRKAKMRLLRRKSAPYPALAGRHEYCGLRQSMPSSRQASWALVNDTTPSIAEGQMNRPFSSRLA